MRKGSTSFGACEVCWLFGNNIPVSLRQEAREHEGTQFLLEGGIAKVADLEAKNKALTKSLGPRLSLSTLILNVCPAYPLRPTLAPPRPLKVR